uniref:PGG domain-containing protein n=1 Tax=Oryza meridionalis TaxID=40149 RepID=A0A0E0FAL6_9ORYZ
MERAQPEPAPIAAAPGHEPITAAGAESQPAADAHAVLECPAALDHPAASIDAAALPPPRMPKHLYLAVFNGEKANEITALLVEKVKPPMAFLMRNLKPSTALLVEKTEKVKPQPPMAFLTHNLKPSTALLVQKIKPSTTFQLQKMLSTKKIEELKIFTVSTVLTMSKYKACFAPRRQDHVTEWRSKDKKKWRDNTSKNLIMVSALVATLAFAAIFDVPSTITGDDEAKLTSNTMYNAYIMLLTGAVLTSVAATLLLIYARTSESRGSWLCFMLSFHLVWISLICLINASLAAVAAVVTKQYFVEWIFNVGMYILIMVFTSLVTPAPLFLTRLRKFVFNMVPRRSRLAISRRYPMTTRFVLNVLFFLAINIVAHAICVFVSLMVP